MTERDVALKMEVDFWDAIAGGTFHNKAWCESFPKRVAGKSGFPQYLVKYCRKDGPTRVLDVGSGPATTLGTVGAPENIEITAVDPLAEEYNRVLSKHSLTPRVPTLWGEAERLSETLPINSFDLVFSRNALDHVADPQKSFVEMMEVCRPGGAIWVEGDVNEGVKQRYHQLHKWNFMPCDGDLIIWTPQTAWSLQRFLGSAGIVNAQRTGEWYKVEIRKAAPDQVQS